jgi:hypothetical protein
MRNKAFKDRALEFLENVKLYNELNFTQDNDILRNSGDVWEHTVRSYIQNIGLDNLGSLTGVLDGIKMFTTRQSNFVIQPPVSFRTHEELGNPSLVGQYTHSVDNLEFNTKQEIVDFLVGNLIQDREIFLYTLSKISYVNTQYYNMTEKWLLRCKVIDWSTVLNRTNFSFLNFKKDFTPKKNIPTFTM